MSRERHGSTIITQYSINLVDIGKKLMYKI